MLDPKIEKLGIFTKINALMTRGNERQDVFKNVKRNCTLLIAELLLAKMVLKLMLMADRNN